MATKSEKTVSNTKNTTEILKCGCVSPDQDRLYGPNRRVMNRVLKATQVTYRCTVCGAIHRN